MNDPQFVEAARALAQNALISAHGNANRGFDYMAIRLLARKLDARERDVVTRSYHDYLSYYDSNRQDAAKLLSVGESKADSRLSKPEFAAMTMVANQLFNLDEVLVK
jgi:DNA-directed RNA polymerase specialized sigma24 family protein